jgi:hypothetical protein
MLSVLFAVALAILVLATTIERGGIIENDVPVDRNLMRVAYKAGVVPAAGHLLKWDTTKNYGVDVCAADNNPVARTVRVLGAGAAGGEAMVELLAGRVVRVPYSGAPARGDKVEADGTFIGGVKSKVRPDNANGVGRVLAVDPPGQPADGSYVDVLF